MIGFSLPAEVWVEEEAGPRQVTVIVSLDLDGDVPQLDVRLADGSIIVNVSPADAHSAMRHIDNQRWELDAKEAPDAA
jgi:hypothetical protein